MTYDGKLLARARDALEAIRAENQAEHQRRLMQVYKRLPRIRIIDETMRRQMAELVRLTISKPADLKEKLKELENMNLDLQAERAELLTEYGYGMDYLDDIYSCPICRDSGQDGGKVCSCLEKLYNKELTKELGTLMQNGDECFEKFDLSLYPVEPVGNVVPRKRMQLIFDACKNFADNFPNVSSNLLLQGGTGLGKTYLSACIARVVAAKGCSVCYDSAFSAFEYFEKQKFSRSEEESELAATRVRRMLSCDLMILDDLGTEMITPMSTSALYTLINTRLVNGKKTIISTNCTLDELQKKYSAQICSRIQGEFLHLPFVGKDIRLIRKGV